MGNCKLFCFYENKVEIIINKNISIENNPIIGSEKENLVNKKNEKILTHTNNNIRVSSLTKYQTINTFENIKAPDLDEKICSFRNKKTYGNFENIKNESDSNHQKVDSPIINIVDKNQTKYSFIQQKKKGSPEVYLDKESSNNVSSKNLSIYKIKQMSSRKIIECDNSEFNMKANNDYIPQKKLLTDEESHSLYNRFTKINLIKKIQKNFMLYYIKKIHKINLFEGNFNLSLAFKNLKSIQYSDGSLFKGQTNLDKRNGVGILTGKNYTYTGFFENDKSSGFGIMKTKNNLFYVGNWVDFKINNIGKFSNLNNGTVYEGFFDDSQQNGYGIEKWVSNSYFEGEYIKDIKSGIGILTFDDQSFYSGEFNNDDMNGVGKYNHKDGSFYIGEWKNNKMHGLGIYTWSDGSKFEGEFVDDMKNGFGVLRSKNNKIYFGFWINDFLEGEGCVLEDNRMNKYIFIKSKKRKLLPESYILGIEKVVEDYIKIFQSEN